MSILMIGLLCLYLAFNCVISKMMSVKEMKARFIIGQNIVGMVASNIFYSPAWALKGLKFLANKLIK